MGRACPPLLAAAFVLSAGCYYTDAGLPPPASGFYYPTGLVISPGRNVLYVANSDFDLQYNGGTVQAVDLAPVRASVDPLLTGIRAATAEGWPDLSPLCQATGVSTGTVGLFKPCVAAADCESGACNTGPDGVSKVCDPKLCTGSGDCASQLCAIGSDGMGGTRGVCLSGTAGALAAPCTSGNDCLSGHCTIGSDGVNGTCTPCGADADCYPSRCGCPRDAGGNCVANSNSPCTLDVNNNEVLEPSACTPVLPAFRASATIGAFASGAVLAQNPDRSAGGARLFVPVRGDPSITWFDVADDRPTCSDDSGCSDPKAPHCSHGVCVACVDNAGCAAGQACYPQDHQCRTKCSADKDCCDPNQSDCTTFSTPYCDDVRGGSTLACVGCLANYNAADFASGNPPPGECIRERPFCDHTSGKCSLCDPSQQDCTPAVPDPFRLDCGQLTAETTTGEGQGDGGTTPTSGLNCDDDHRMGVDPFDNFRDVGIPVEPVGMDVSGDGQAIVSGHNISGGPAVGLSVNPWGSCASPSDPCSTLNGSGTAPIYGPGNWPAFEYTLTGTVPNGPSEVAHIPPPLIVSLPQRSGVCASLAPSLYQPGFVMTFNAAAEADIFRVDYDRTSSPPRPFVTRASATAITVQASGTDSRGVAIDSSERQACEASCGATAACVCDPQKPADTSRCPPITQAQHDCLVACTNIPLRAFIANRLPPALLLGRIRTTYVDTPAQDVPASLGVSAYDTLEIYGQTPLDRGASKVVMGQAIQPDGTPKTYVFAVAFDTRFIFMYDPEADSVVQVIYTGRGPHAVAFDSCTGPGCAKPYSFLYVGHFTDSYLGVVDLDMRHITFGTMFASIGVPLEPVESQMQ